MARPLQRRLALVGAILMLTSMVPLGPGFPGPVGEAQAQLGSEHVGNLAVRAQVLATDGNIADFAKRNDILTIRTTVTNTASAGSANNFTVRVQGLFDNGGSPNPYGEDPNWCAAYSAQNQGDFLGPGESVTFTRTFEYDIPHDQNEVEMEARGTLNDCGDPQFADTDSSDNTGTKTVLVGRMPDLAPAVVRWCAGDTDGSSCSGNDMGNEGQTSNSPSPTHFEVDVSDVSKPGNDTDNAPFEVQDPDTGEPIPFNVSFTVRHNITGDTFKTIAEGVTDFATVESGVFDLQDKAGNYTLTVVVDSKDRIREWNDGNNSQRFYFHVGGVDLLPQVHRSDLKTDPSDPFGSSPTSNNVEVTTSIWNNGTHAFEAAGGGTRNLEWVGTLDPGTDQEQEIWNDTLDVRIPTREAVDASETFGICSDTAKACYRTPGKHVLLVEVDQRNLVSEESEANNADTDPGEAGVVFYVTDPNPPNVQDFDVNVTDTRSGSPVKFTADIEEADIYFEDAWVNLTPPGEDAGNELIPLAFTDRIGDVYQMEAIVENGFQKEGAYTFTIIAEDPIGNRVETIESGSFTVTPWPKATEVTYPRDGRVFSWAEGGRVVRMNVTINQTGYDEPTVEDEGTIVKGLWWTKPNGDRVPDSGLFELRSEWERQGCQDTPDDPTCQELRDEFYFNFHFNTVGRFNFTFVVTDIAGESKNTSHLVRYLDDPPVIHYTEVTEEVDAGGNVSILANVSDDAFEVEQVHVNLTHVATGKSLSRELALSSGNGTLGNWTDEIATGFGEPLDHAGTWNWTIAAEDTSGNWRETDGDLEVVDTRAPVIEDEGDAFGVTPEEREVDRDFTFFARVNDDTNVTVTAIVRDTDDGTEVARFQLFGPDENGRWTAERAFSSAGTYEVQVEVEDSAGRSVASSTKAFVVVENNPPTVEVLEPSARTNATQFIAGTQPALVLEITDGDDVNPDSVNLSIDGAFVEGYKLQRLADDLGYELSYTTEEVYEHGDTVIVRVRATDESPRALGMDENLTLRIDGRPPETLEPVFAPKYRAHGDVWNVSLHTEWRLQAADDIDGPAAGVKDTHWRLQKESVGAVQTYDEPFKVSKSTSGYQGPGTYTFTYWSEDAAGNVESSNTIRVNFDEDGPTITYFPKGRYVNATVTDPHGVTDVTLHHREQGASDYTSEAMTFEDGLYRGILPEVQAGTTMEFYITAKDNLANRGTRGSPENPFRHTSGNHPPAVTLLAPSPGEVVSGTTLVEWEASDADGDELTTKVEVRLAREGEDFRTLATLQPGTSAFRWDTRELQDGSYDLRVSVADGESVGLAAVRVQVKNAERVADPMPPNVKSIRPGEPVIFTAKVNKAPTEVLASFLLDGEVIDTVPMRDDGQQGDAIAGDGTYSVRYTFSEPGSYGWRVTVSYEDAEGRSVTESVEGDDGVTVFLTSSDIFSRNLGLWMAVIVLTLAAAGLAGYALMNRWKREGT